MKKKTRYRSRSSYLPYSVSVFLCLLGFVASIYLFYLNFNKILSKNEEPIATVTFKYKTAQRKFLGRNIWDRLQQESPVYNGDTIHTANLSEAVIIFTDGNRVELSDNSMAQIFMQKDNSIKTELSSGSAFVDSTDSQNKMILSAGGVEINLESGSSLSAVSGDDSSMAIKVISGSATFDQTNVLAGDEVSVAGESVTPSTLKVVYPKPSEKILYHTEEQKSVLFQWQLEKGDESAEDGLNLYIATDKDFRNLVKVMDVTEESSIIISLDAGNYYWRIGNKEVGSQGKLQIIKSLPPELITPYNDYEYQFRTRAPSVRLQWSEADYASSYRVSISKTPDFNSPETELHTNKTSLIVSSLKEGTWYWRVTPFYQLNRAGYEADSETGRFIISKKTALDEPVLFKPKNNGYESVGAELAPISFSWKQDGEAESYNFVISKNEDLSNPVFKTNIKENFLKYENSAKLEKGAYYWGVSQQDAEGTVSKMSNIRRLYVVDGQMEQHLVEPFEFFGVARNLLQDTKFSWKKNMPESFTTEFQIAKDENFTKLVSRTVTSNTSAQGPDLSEGTYYWRIVSVDPETGTEFVTPSRVFSVLGGLAKSKKLKVSNKAVARETEPYTFEWEPVAGADMYKFTIYSVDTNEIVYEDNVYEAKALVDMYHPKNFVDKANYRYEVQAKSLAVPGVKSRLSGETAEEKFTLIKLKPVSVVLKDGKKTLENKAKLSGEQVIVDPYTISWSSVDEVKKASITVNKIIGLRREPVLVINGDGKENFIAPTSVPLDNEDGFREGNYEIIVNAFTMDDIDISNTQEKYKTYFSVNPISPLDSVKGLSVNPQVIDADYAKANPGKMEFKFSWQKVTGATHYNVTVSRKEKRKTELLYSERIADATTFQFDLLNGDLSDETKMALMSGDFEWTVEPIRIIKRSDGKEMVLQTGKQASSSFKTDIPSAGKTKKGKVKNPYGL
ncbi:MAG: FecR family protein [Treponema sp.]|nr:FecR family protein [Treponema sp.]